MNKFKNTWIQQLLKSSHIGISVVDNQRNNLYVNKRLCELFGYTQEEILATNARIFHTSEESFLQFGKTAFSFVLEGKPVGFDYQFKKKDGTLFWCNISGDLIENQEEVLWSIIDVSERKKEQKELQETNYNLQQYMDVIDKIDIGIFVVDDDFSIRFMNNTMKKWFGEKTGETCYSSVANLDEPCPYCKLHEVIHENKKVIYEPTTSDGQSFDIVATSIKNPDGTTSKMEVIRNITDKKNSERHLIEQKEELKYQAHHDALTGLANRVLFNDRLEQGIKKAKRLENKLALFFIDLDHFKEINDSLGHHIGDIVLQKTTKKLSSVIREEDSLARLGGDEFTVIIENLEKSQDASVFASKILEVLAEPIVIEENTLYVSSSIGISIYPDDGIDVQDLLKFADSAMYKAKDEGRNNFQFYSAEMTELAFERIVMETSLRQAIQKNEFVVYYQPQVDAQEDKLIGMEALVRWNHPLMGIVFPAKFIPLAESTGLIVELDRLVMKEALAQFASWKKAGLAPGVLAINLAVQQLQQKDFIEFYQEAIEESGCSYEDIELEVTESQIMKRPDEAIKILTKIGDLGTSIAIDDFGTGYSSLSYLKKLPINKLKIDQSFIRDLSNADEDKSISIAIIALANILNLKVLAEGVEMREQKEFLLQNGCHIIQGYYYSKPIPANKIQNILENGFNL